MGKRKQLESAAATITNLTEEIGRMEERLDAALNVPTVRLGTYVEPYALPETTVLYVSGPDAYSTAISLLIEAQNRDDEPTFLNLAVQWLPAGADGEPSYYAGTATVGI